MSLFTLVNYLRLYLIQRPWIACCVLYRVFYFLPAPPLPSYPYHNQGVRAYFLHICCQRKLYLDNLYTIANFAATGPFSLQATAGLLASTHHGHAPPLHGRQRRSPYSTFVAIASCPSSVRHSLNRPPGQPLSCVDSHRPTFVACSHIS